MPPAARQVAERLRSNVEALELEHPSGGPVTVSVGVATAARRSGDDPRTLVSAADDALYRAKRGGRNRVEVCDVELGSG